MPASVKLDELNKMRAQIVYYLHIPFQYVDGWDIKDFYYIFDVANEATKMIEKPHYRKPTLREKYFLSETNG